MIPAEIPTYSFPVTLSTVFPANTETTEHLHDSALQTSYEILNQNTNTSTSFIKKYSELFNVSISTSYSRFQLPEQPIQPARIYDNFISSILSNIHFSKIRGSTSDSLIRFSTEWLDKLEPTPSEIESSLLQTIKHSTFEYGFYSEVDEIISNWMKSHREETLATVNSMFLDHYHDPEITLGIVRAISRLTYEAAYPVGQTIALAALSHKSDLVVEAGIRAYEMWDDPKSLPLLKSTKVRSKWLSNYLELVIKDLSESNENVC